MIYEWDFGDGSPTVSGSDPTATHVYGVAGNYTVSLTVTDGAGSSDSDSTLVTSAIVVPVDIRPGSCPNSLNCKAQGVLPVAIAGTVDLDATTIDPVTVRLAGVAPLRCYIENVTMPVEPFTGKQDCNVDCLVTAPDGFNDLTLKFDLQEVAAALGDTVQDGACVVVELSGNLRESAGGTPIVGEDVVRILCKGGGTK